MNLQGRNLSLQTSLLVGDDVKLLQHELTQLGSNLPADEVGRGVFGLGTRDAVQQFQDRFAAELHASGWPGEFGVVEAITAQFINREVGQLGPGGEPTRFVVRGVVRHSDGKPFSGAVVAAVDQDLRGEKALGQTTTDAAGRYEIRYTPAQLAGAETHAADLVVRVLNAAGAVLTASPTLFNAPQEAIIDLVVPDTAPGLPSEYERLVREIEPLLANVTVPGVLALTLVDKLADLKQEEIDFLANEAGIQRQKIGFLVAAAHLQQQAMRASFNLPVEVFYGLAREGLPTELAALGLRSQQERSDALGRALKDNIIPAALRDSLPALLDQLQRLAVSQALQTPPPDGAHSLGDLLGTVIPSPQQQTTLLALSTDHVGTPEEFWKNLRAHPDFQQPGVVDRLQLTLQLGLLTQNHLPLIQQLQQMDIKSTRDLVKLDAVSWRDLISKQIDGRPIGVPRDVPGDNPEEQSANYVRGIVSTLQAAFPTETVVQMVAKAPNIGIDGPMREAVGRFFSNSPDFDLRSSRIDSYVSGHPDALNGVAEQDKPKAVEQLKRLQRAFQVSTSSDTMSVLLSQGLDSALAIANIPRSSFVEQYKTQMGGEAQAQGVYDRAVAINSRTLHLYSYLNDALNGANPQALNIDQQAVAQAVVKHIPNYTKLFGSLDLCDCQQCQSVFSPAAYLVDLLEFLRKSQANKGKTPLDVLLGRRPDLANLRLTCENTNTTLPYVDLVNEVLESYVALGKPDASAAHNTENVTTPELDANPQYTLDEADKALDHAMYPFTLPFNLPVAISRVYLEHLGSSRAELLNTFQTSTSPAVIRARAAEYLKITAEEYPILTGANFDPNVAVQARPLREFYGYGSDQVNRPKKNQTKVWKDWLADVPEFLQRTGIAYTDLVELLKTRFINPAYPQGEALTFFLRTPLSFATLNKLVQSNFVNPDKSVLDALQAAGIKLQELIGWSNANFQKAAKLIVLDAQDSKCDLSVTRMQHLDGTLLDDAELGKLHRLIRLWRKLGWSIADVDRALSALKAADITPDVLSQFAQIKQLQNDLNISSLQVVLSFWASINTRGDDSLYKKLFLSKAALRTDPDFEPEKKDGSVLTKAGLKISDHIPALLAALRVNAADFAAIRVDAHLDADTKPLTLENVSILYRYAALGQALRLRVGDLLSLKTLTGIDPFATPAQTIQFVALAGKVQRSGFAIAQLNYLYRHLTAPPANLAPQSTTVLLLAKALRDGLGKIAQDNALAPDPVGDLTRAKLALLFDAATVDQTIAMINGSALYVAPLAKLPDAIAKKGASNKVIGIDPAKVPALVAKKVSYDPKASMLRFQGAMTTDEQTALKNAASAAAFQAAVNSIYQQPSTFVQSALSGFLDVKDAEKNLLRATRSLDQDLQPVLLDEKNNPTSELKKAVNTVIAQKFAYLLAHFLPYLRDQLSRMFAKQIIGDALKLDAAVAQALLETVLKSADSMQRALADLLALAVPGLTAEYFTSKNFSGTPTVRTDPARVPDPADKAKAPLPPGTESARWSGMLLSPANGELTFAISGSTKVQMWLGEDLSPVSLQLDATTSEMVSQPVPLKADQFYHLRLEFSQLPPNTVLELRWQSPTVPKTVIPLDNLYPRNALDNLAATLTRLQKAALIVNNFKLTDREVAYVSGHPKDFDGFDLNSLPLTRDDSNAKQIDASAPALFKAWQRVSHYVTLRDSLPQGEVSLIDVFGSASLNDATLKLAQATGWDRPIIDALTGTDGFKLNAADFKNEIWVTRLQASVRLVKRLGGSVPTIFTWASIDADFPKLLSIAQDIKKSVRAKYDEESWLAVAKPLNDKLRESQRDALVAYLLPRFDLTDSNQLFEFFLIDVDMSACMETSRIKQAISSVQLFVQRCLMNLEQRDGVSEPSVSPSQIDWNHWQWMKHYRVWEANRKVFLYPENWIEPELRDDKSPFFKELESELLQDEITQDTVETAFVNYLQKLDEVARLEICGMYWQDKDPDTNESVNMLHVFGRTFNTPHVYYYRRLLNNTTWTPWEKVQVDIQGTEEGGVHLVPAIRNRRLHIFWPVFMNKPRSNTVYWEIRIAWSEYTNGMWCPKKLSGISVPTYVPTAQLPLHTFHFRALDRPKFGVSIFGSEPGAADLSAEPSSSEYDEFLFDDCCELISTATGSEWAFIPPFTDMYFNHEMLYQTTKNFGGLRLWTTSAPNAIYSGAYSGNYQDFLKSVTLMPALQTTPSSFRILYPHQFSQFVLQAPFFFQDNQRTFFVKPHSAIRFVDQVVQSSKVDINQYAHIRNNAMGLANGTERQMAAASSESRVNNWASQEIASQSNWMAEAPQASHFVITTNLSFAPFWHPFVCEFIKALKRRGLPELLSLASQSLHETDILYVKDKVFKLGTLFERQYKPTNHVNHDYPVEEVDFTEVGSYSLYNWELFFHAPLLIAARLSKNQRFEEAQRWFHYILDPTDSGGKFWKVLPFTTAEASRIQDLMLLLSTEDTDQKAKKEQLIRQWEEVKDHPFQPHLIARMRPSAYMKNVFMKYLDNLIAWGDQLFRQDTIEFINEATQLYVLAADLLGPRPQRLPRRGIVAPETYTTLKDKLDKFSNALVSFENDFPFSNGVSSSTTGESARLLGLGQALYFCVPQNDKLLGYWDTVGDRLFKIRHCMNIEGVVRELPLFEPPIDPALLVQAAAKGVDLSSVLNDLSAPLPYYRFGYLVARALEACADVKALGALLFATIEKCDAEELAMIRAGQETAMLNLITQVKQQQIDEARVAMNALLKSRDSTSLRVVHYQALLGVAGFAVPPYQRGKEVSLQLAEVNDLGNTLNSEESEYLDDLTSAHKWQADANQIEMIGSALTFALPDLTWKIGPSPPDVTYGMRNVQAGLSAVARAFEATSATWTYWANQAATLGSHRRRMEEWNHQSALALAEIKQIDKQIDGANIRSDIAQMELDNHQKQIENAQQIEDFLRNKFTNEELYAWMQGEITGLYFQSYEMAYDLAKKAERAFRFERGLTDSNFIQFGYWDSLRKGLLAGDRLYLALKQMERAYHDQNKREYEITRHVSLQLHDPMALITLKQTGQCEIFLPESLFDADYPGHYIRRIKSVSLTLPCVVGPYTSINCTLTLLSNKTRIKSTLADGYLESQDTEDSRFVTNYAAMQSIATSHAQNDSGLFELNFRDERYLPFEGAGAISRWRLELPKETNAFDLSTVTDVVLHLKYTAREGGEILRKAASQALTDWIANAEGAPLMRLLSSRHEFPSEWARFLRPTDQNATSQKLTLDLSMERFPYLFRGRKLAVSKIDVFFTFQDRERIADYGKGQPLVFTLTPEGGSGATDDLDSVASLFAGTPHKQMGIDFAPPAKLSLEVKEDDVKKIAAALREPVPPTGPGHIRLRSDAIDDLLYVIHYSVS